MTMSRRKMLSLVGGGTVLAATVAAGGFLTTRTPTAALAPWQAAGNYPDLPRRVLSYALLAPNPHNRQPWIADITSNNQITIYRDHARNLPETDPFDRQLTIGMGCFLELLSQAAAQERVGTEMTLFPDGEGPDAPVARVTLSGTAQPDPLFAQVMNRHTDRSPYDVDQPVPDAELALIAATATQGVGIGTTNTTEMVGTLRDLTREAIVLELETPHTYRESVELMRIGRAEIEANPDGLSLGGPLMDSLRLVGLLSRESAADQTGRGFQSVVDRMRTSFNATPAFFWLATPGNSRTDQIAAGRSWVRAHLAATAAGLSVQPVSQSLQEYTEMSAHFDRVHTLLAPSGDVLQMLGRVGYGPGAGPAPRWPLEARMINA